MIPAAIFEYKIRFPSNKRITTRSASQHQRCIRIRNGNTKEDQPRRTQRNTELTTSRTPCSSVLSVVTNRGKLVLLNLTPADERSGVSRIGVPKAERGVRGKPRAWGRENW